MRRTKPHRPELSTRWILQSAPRRHRRRRCRTRLGSRSLGLALEGSSMTRTCAGPVLDEWIALYLERGRRHWSRPQNVARWRELPDGDNTKRRTRRAVVRRRDIRSSAPGLLCTTWLCLCSHPHRSKGGCSQQRGLCPHDGPPSPRARMVVVGIQRRPRRPAARACLRAGCMIVGTDARHA